MAKKVLFLFLALTYMQVHARRMQVQNYFVNKCNLKLTEVIMEDIFSPPVASRIQEYANIACYEVLTQQFTYIKTMAGHLNELTPIPKATENVNLLIAAEVAFIETAKKMVYSEKILSDFLSEDLKTTNMWTDSSIIIESTNYGKQVAAHIFAWAKEDNYIHTRTLERYVQSNKPDAWRPTAPEYANALEPNWYLMRSFIENNSSYIKIVPNIPYSENKKSQYYKNAMQVYKTSLQKDSAKIKTALYWDDNPNTAVYKGHMTFFVHKVTPGGHWIKITAQTIEEKRMNIDAAAELFTMVAIATYEGFLTCWAEKYKSNAVRPETYINKLIAPRWTPLIETPPFPEYTSGHSVISAASASILTHYIPQPYRFTDNSQRYLAIEPRSYESFLKAADEASISRFYGGIHYMPALNNGNKQGKDIAAYILKKIHTR